MKKTEKDRNEHLPCVLEVCADSAESAIAAQTGGADRIELSSALIIGGISPGAALFRQVRRYTDLEVRVLLRPRFGDFCYSKYEQDVLKEEVQLFRELGADGVVIGSLNPDGTLNMDQMEELVHLAGDMKVTMHRAFDVCRDPFEALEQCRKLGIDTILTSGQKASAWEGRYLLAELMKKAEGKVEILAGAGIRPETVADLAAFTGGKECLWVCRDLMSTGSGRHRKKTSEQHPVSCAGWMYPTEFIRRYWPAAQIKSDEKNRKRKNIQGKNRLDKRQGIV